MGKENLFKCYCQAREAQAFYSKCLDGGNNYTLKEKELIYDLVKDNAKAANKIKKCF